MLWKGNNKLGNYETMLWNNFRLPNIQFYIINWWSSRLQKVLWRNGYRDKNCDWSNSGCCKCCSKQIPIFLNVVLVKKKQRLLKNRIVGKKWSLKEKIA